MNEKRGIFVFVFCILNQSASQIYFNAIRKILYLESALCNQHFDFKESCVTDKNAKHVSVYSLRRHNVMLVVFRQYLVAICRSIT